MAEKLTDLFASAVFSDRVMQQRLSSEDYKRLKTTMENRLPLSEDLAEVVAAAMRDWALDQGATHYTHWFQPLTNISAGKHDALIAADSNGNVLLDFSGKALSKGEPDASSFPSGGLRATFEARGYTTWDPSSPAFIKGDTLYIPTAFCSYTGEALDTKTPLLRSMQVINREALRVLRALGNDSSKQVFPTVGAEQEYFLVDRKMFENRLDLKICGRTLIGARPPKGQELDDHYCGRIRLRVYEFMRHVDERLWRLGVCAKTRHNEVAPAQHELACLYTTANIACDHNQLTMEIMRTEAKKLGLACLLHEKPFSGVNGSGKHNNWSLATDDGLNLLSPGKDPEHNLTFLVFFCAVITAVDRYPELLRMTTASPGNDFRLGAGEAPPAIISIFLGDALTDVLSGFVEGNHTKHYSESTLHTGVSILADVERDNSDRNRTSPFAFTGNKFEFRMLGAPASVADVNSVLNTIVSEVLCEYADRLERASSIEQEVAAIVQDCYKNHGRIISNDNNYSDEWVAEAARRGLPNISNAVDAMEAMVQPRSISLFERFGIFSQAECHARYEIMLENYVKVISIEAATLIEMIRRQILPAVIDRCGSLARSVHDMRRSGCGVSSVAQNNLSSLVDFSDLIDQGCSVLEDAVSELSSIEDFHAKAVFCRDRIRSAMLQLRHSCDGAEVLVKSEAWPIPTYTDLLHRI